MSREKADIWMPIYIGDYLADTTRLTTEQHGAYFLLILDYWKSGRPPDDDAVLAQITRLSPHAWSIARAMLARFFSIENGEWIHHRIERELEAARGNAKRNTEKAQKAALARWKNAQSIAPGIAPALLDECPSPSPSPIYSSLDDVSAVDSGKSGDNPVRVRGSRLSPEMVLPDEWWDFCKATHPHLHPPDVFAAFRDYWISKPGKYGVKCDWLATWRNWVRREGGTRSGKRETSFDRGVRERREWLEEQERLAAGGGADEPF